MMDTTNLLRTPEDPRELYLQGYAAFDDGNFDRAITLATDCLENAPENSYWHFGAVGLRCWAANYRGDREGAKEDARTLLMGQEWEGKAWFDGLALLNLGLIHRGEQDAETARTLFALAAERFSDAEVDVLEESEWRNIHRFFAAISRQAALGIDDALIELVDELENQPVPDEESWHICWAIDLYRRHGRGKDVRVEAATAVMEGVSRAFLALLIL